MSHDMKELRAHLFETLQAVRRGEIELDHARAVNEIGKTLIDTAKVEVEYLRSVGDGGSTFIAPEQPDGQQQQRPGILGTRVHRLRG